MGVFISGHAGVFLRVKTTSVSDSKKIRTCTQQACSRHSKRESTDIHFCSQCGQLVKPVTFECSKTVGWYDFAEYYDELLESAEQFDVTPTRSRRHTTCVDDLQLVYDVDIDATEEILINNVRHESDLKWKPDNSCILSMQEMENAKAVQYTAFEKQHKELLEAMYVYFGEENVIPDYGVLVWYS